MPTTTSYEHAVKIATSPVFPEATTELPPQPSSSQGGGTLSIGAQQQGETSTATASDLPLPEATIF